MYSAYTKTAQSLKAVVNTQCIVRSIKCGVQSEIFWNLFKISAAQQLKTALPCLDFMADNLRGLIEVDTVAEVFCSEIIW